MYALITYFLTKAASWIIPNIFVSFHVYLDIYGGAEFWITNWCNNGHQGENKFVEFIRDNNLFLEWCYIWTVLFLAVYNFFWIFCAIKRFSPLYEVVVSYIIFKIWFRRFGTFGFGLWPREITLHNRLLSFCLSRKVFRSNGHGTCRIFNRCRFYVISNSSHPNCRVFCFEFSNQKTFVKSVIILKK